MIWMKIEHMLITTLTLSLCRKQALGNLPLYSTDVDKDAIAVIEKTLLGILGMNERPRRSKRDMKIPQYMLDLYEKQVNSDLTSTYFSTETSQHANTVRSFTTIGTKAHSVDGNILNLYFNTSTIPSQEEIISAKLQLSLGNISSTNYKYRVDVYEILSSHHSVEKAITRLIDTKTVHSGNGSSWLHLDITPALHRWRQRSGLINGIQIHVKSILGGKTSNHVRLRRDNLQSKSEWADSQPHLVVYSHDRTLQRSKRATKKRNRPSKKVKSECQRHEMRVDFKDVGWEDWILAPQGYDAYYCHGECSFPLSEHLNATNHAIIQTLVNENEPEVAPPACCVPTDLSPISMLYVNGDEVVLKNYPDMVVEACGCR